jgi:hypothetical protein
MRPARHLPTKAVLFLLICGNLIGQRRAARIMVFGKGFTKQDRQIKRIRVQRAAMMRQWHHSGLSCGTHTDVVIFDFLGRKRVDHGSLYALANTIVDVLRRAFWHFFSDHLAEIPPSKLSRARVKQNAAPDRQLTVTRYPARGKCTQTVPTSSLLRSIEMVSAFA